MATHPYDAREIGARVRLLRKAFDLTQAAFAAQIGASDAQVRQWEAGNNRPGHEAIYAMKRVFGVPSDWILYGDDSALGALGVTLGVFQIIRRNGTIEPR